jgi:sugar transferase (PEP-CTERM/EpsH1 system associated)
MSARPLIAHVVVRFDVGGLENGVVNLINRLPADEFRHAIIALTQATDFSARLRRADVTVHSLNKQSGKDPAAYVRLYGLLRKLRPDILHTRNVGTIECQLVGSLAGVRTRVHGEHGWDSYDPDGTRRKYRALRRAANPFIHRFVTVSRDLERWLIERVGIPARKVVHICNGVDTQRFQPPQARGGSEQILPSDRFPPGCVIVGSVTRFEPIKDPLNLVRAFIAARTKLTAQASPVDLRLVMVGDGPLRAQALEALEAARVADAAWLPGARNDVAEWLHAIHYFALGSRREGISNTVLEAMASGLPVIASATGGNLELIVPGVTGTLVPPEDTAALARALEDYASDAPLRARHAQAARARAVEEFSLDRMVAAYRDLYLGARAHLGVAA